MPKRLRLLIYEHATQEGLEKQRNNEFVQGHRDFAAFGNTKGFGGSGMLSLTSIELNPARITILELLRLFGRELKERMERADGNDR